MGNFWHFIYLTFLEWWTYTEIKREIFRYFIANSRYVPYIFRVYTRYFPGYAALRGPKNTFYNNIADWMFTFCYKQMFIFVSTRICRAPKIFLIALSQTVISGWNKLSGVRIEQLALYRPCFGLPISDHVISGCRVSGISIRDWCTRLTRSLGLQIAACDVRNI